eukprot:gene9747-7622_t
MQAKAFQSSTRAPRAAARVEKSSRVDSHCACASDPENTLSRVDALHRRLRSEVDASDPLMLRALRGEVVERPPVWMMRQAGRYMKVYQELVKKHPTFRERSERVDLSVEITLQPWHAFKPDGVVLFSDILTPLSGMNIPFDIGQGNGPVIFEPIRTMEQVKKVTKLNPKESCPFVGESLCLVAATVEKVTKLNPEESCPFVGESLCQVAATVDKVTKLNPEESCPFVGESLRQVAATVGNTAAVLGFVGAPWTLATYIVEGGSSKNFAHIKKMAFSDPTALHALLEKLTDNITEYCRYQADSGAQVIQIFDSWASELAPQDFEVFAGPYIKRIISDFKSTHPHVPIILYISGGGGLLERMADCKPDCISLDQSVDLIDGINSPIFLNFKYVFLCSREQHGRPGVLFVTRSHLRARDPDNIRQAKSMGVRHVMNLGHGVLPGTPEENVAHFFEVAKTAHERM